MSPSESVLAMEVLWESMCQADPEPSSAEWHEAVLEERRRKAEVGEGGYVTLQQLRQKLGRRSTGRSRSPRMRSSISSLLEISTTVRRSGSEITSPPVCCPILESLSFFAGIHPMVYGHHRCSPSGFPSRCTTTSPGNW